MSSLDSSCSDQSPDTRLQTSSAVLVPKIAELSVGDKPLWTSQSHPLFDLNPGSFVTALRAGGLHQWSPLSQRLLSCSGKSHEASSEVCPLSAYRSGCPCATHEFRPDRRGSFIAHGAEVHRGIDSPTTMSTLWENC